MPLYFFDIQDGDRRVRDNEGTELPDVQAAMNETQAALADTAKDKLPDGDAGTSSSRCAKATGSSLPRPFRCGSSGRLKRILRLLRHP
jgi:hypothetical protein